MIECIKNESGDITAVCEWLLFNDKAMIDDNGTIVMIAELHINNEHRGNGVLKKFIKSIASKCPQADKVFFFREHKYPGRKIRVYSRERILKRIGE
jgi:hypothetical protein